MKDMLIRLAERAEAIAQTAQPTWRRELLLLLASDLRAAAEGKLK